MKNLLSCIILITFTAGISAQCLEGNCYNGNGTYLYKSGAEYTGTFKNGKINGLGTLLFSNGNTYTGKWKDDYREGRGDLVFVDGGYYTGAFKKSQFNGYGEFNYPNGDLYKGEWEKNLPEGNGEYSFASGDQYQGQFKGGKFHGDGTMYYATGSKYIGQWAHNEKEGKGKVFNIDGSTQEGNWAAGEMVKTEHTTKEKIHTPTPASKRKPTISNKLSPKQHIKDCNKGFCNQESGQYTYIDGTRYLGDFMAGKPHGKGTVFYANGDKYVGAWDTNRPHGDGVLYFKNGRVLQARWKDGNVVKQVDVLNDMPEEVVEVDTDNEVKIWSVIVGVSRYTHMPTLKYTDDDAYQIYAFLKSPEGGAVPDKQIAVLIDEDANRDQIIRTMKRKFHKADANDVILFYFSGHGYDGSFIPSDFDGTNNLLSHQDIISILEDSKAKHKVVFADACHSGSLDQNNTLAMKSPYVRKLTDYYSQFKDSNGGLALLLSSKQTEYSLEDQGLRQGVFSHYLMRGLKGEANANNDYTISISELYDYVHSNVTRYTGNIQTPNISGNYDKNMPVAMIR